MATGEHETKCEALRDYTGQMFTRLALSGEPLSWKITAFQKPGASNQGCPWSTKEMRKLRVLLATAP